jgi:type II secretory pathway component GspD/PulD (secretin)
MRLVQSELAGYRPDYVSPGALLAAVEPVFPGVKFSVITGEGQRPALFASGPVEDVARFKEMAAYLDRVPDAVEVQAIVLEVTSTDRSGFGVSMVLDALRSGIGFNIAGDQQSNSLTFRSGSFDGVLSAVAATSNAKVLSSPRLRGRSGEKLRLQVGADVPTLGTVVENPSGSTAQSIQYRSSGVIFEVVPTVFGKRIGLSVHQELSAFAATETGVRGSPTLSTRALDTTLDLESGEWAVIGGLTSQEDTLSRQSLLGLVPLGKTRVKRETELVLLVNVRRVQVQSRSAAVGPAGGQDVAARN